MNWKKTKKKLVKQEKELAATENAEEFRQKGELLTTYLSMVPNDKDSVELDNYYTGEKITIPLNVALTPNQNAQRYLQKIPKTKEAVKHLTGLIEETNTQSLILKVLKLLLVTLLSLISKTFVKSWWKLVLSNAARAINITNVKNQSNTLLQMVRQSSWLDATTCKMMN